MAFFKRSNPNSRKKRTSRSMFTHADQLEKRVLLTITGAIDDLSSVRDGDTNAVTNNESMSSPASESASLMKNMSTVSTESSGSYQLTQTSMICTANVSATETGSQTDNTGSAGSIVTFSGSVNLPNTGVWHFDLGFDVTLSHETGYTGRSELAIFLDQTEANVEDTDPGDSTHVQEDFNSITTGYHTFLLQLSTVSANENAVPQYGTQNAVLTANIIAAPTNVNTVTTLSSAPNPSTYGDPVTFSANVAPVLTGLPLPSQTVTFMDGFNAIGTGTLDSSGTATFTTSTLAVGSHSITAVYNGDNYNNKSTSSPITQSVNAIDTNTSLTSIPNPSEYGQSVTFAATVEPTTAAESDNPTGMVTFLDGLTQIGTGTLDSNGVASFTTSNLAIGNHLITADYEGNDIYGGSDGSVSQTVKAADTTTIVTSDVDPSNSDQLVTFTAAVTPSDSGLPTPTGDVTFLDGTTTIGTAKLNANGEATFSTSSLASGDHLITADYDGNGSYSGSDGSIPQTVKAAATTTILTSNIDPSKSGQLVTFTASVRSSNGSMALLTGNVTFLDGLNTIGMANLNPNGKATFSTSNLASGDHLITADYEGDGNYSGSDGSVPQTVGGLAVLSLVSASVLTDDLTVDAIYRIDDDDLTKPGTIDFYWASGPTFADRIISSSNTAIPMIPTATEAISSDYSAGTFIASLGFRPPTADYILAVADSPDADPDNMVAATLAPAMIVPASRGWDVINGGVDFGYSVVGSLNGQVPVDFYWANDQGGGLALAATSSIQGNNGSSPISSGLLRISQSAFAAPPSGTTELLIIVDPEESIIKNEYSSGSSSLGYDPEIFITSKYGDPIGYNIFGRFLAVPGAITDETLTFQLSDSLAALRPGLTTQGFTNLLLSHEKLNAAGLWDGRTYESDTFDPEMLSRPTIFTTSAFFSGGTDLKPANEIIDVQPLPEWITRSPSAENIVFAVTGIGTDNSEDGLYVYKGLLGTLPLSTNAVIPKKVPLIGGLPIGASASFGIIATIPLNPSTAPTVDTYAQVQVVIAGSAYLDQEFDSFVSTGSEAAGKLTATPEFTLNPETLIPNGSFGIDFTFSLKTELLNKTLNAGFIKIRGIEIPLHLNENISVLLSDSANFILVPSSGYSLLPKQATEFLQATAVLSGSIGYERSISIGGKAATVKVEGVVSGSLVVHNQINYTGGVELILPEVVDFGGSFEPAIVGTASITLGKRIIYSKTSSNLIALYVKNIPISF